MPTAQPFDTDVLILGAGPVGLTLANLLGGYGVRTTLADAGEKLIDYPRGVGLDDESLRTFQTAGVVDAGAPAHHAAAHHADGQRQGTGAGQRRTRRPGLRLVAAQRLHPAAGRRRTARAALSRFDHVDVHFSHTLLGYVDDADGVTATVELADGTQKTIRARYLVGLRRRPQHHPQVDGRDASRASRRPPGSWSSTSATTRWARRTPTSAPTRSARSCPSGCRTASAASSS